MPNNHPVTGHAWLDAATKVVIQVGFPVLVAGVLLWWLLGQFTRDINYIASRMEASATATEKLVDMQKDQLREMEKHTRELREQTVIMKEIARRNQEAR